MPEMIDARLEIDYDRGVIYVHDTLGRTLIRICSLPAPIPVNVSFIDITNRVGSSYTTELDEPSRLGPEDVRIAISGLPKDLPPGEHRVKFAGTSMSVDGGKEQMTIRYKYDRPNECNGANDGSCPKHPEVNCG